MANCKRCGAEMNLTNYNVWYCSNCGKLPENNEDKELIYYEKEVPDYVG